MFALEVGAVPMVQVHEGDHPSRCAAIVSPSEEIGCVLQTLFECVKKARGTVAIALACHRRLIALGHKLIKWIPKL